MVCEAKAGVTNRATNMIIALKTTFFKEKFSSACKSFDYTALLASTGLAPQSTNYDCR